MNKEIATSEPFEKVFEFEKYSVKVAHNRVDFLKGNMLISIPSEFRNEYDSQSGIVTIKNIYLQLTAYYPHEYTKMFDVIAYVFDVKKLVD